MRLKPDSLFGRLIGVLFAGLLLVLFVTLLINIEDRDDLLSRSAGRQAIQRIADTVRLLDLSEPGERGNIIRIVNVPPQQVVLRGAPLSVATGNVADVKDDVAAVQFANALMDVIGQDRKVQVELITISKASNALSGEEIHSRGMGRHGRGHNMQAGTEGENFVPGRYRWQVAPDRGVNIVSFLVQVQLLDGEWVIFDTSTTQDVSVFSWRLLLSLLVLCAAVMGLSYIAVRWLTQPLKQLAQAAEALGQDIHQPPLPEAGPREIRQAAQAFNMMQQRLQHYIQDRTHVFAAMSHDLKTPITRLRLRTEMLGDDGGENSVRQRFEQDLMEMESMVTQTLDFMKGLDNHEARQPIDVNALLESLQEDYHEGGKKVVVEGFVEHPFNGVLSLLKRGLVNLMDNAIFYGDEAHVSVTDDAQYLTIRVRDKGPGIDEKEMERVFDPFYRVEQSRNRATGGSGLGLTIARNIARAHGGDVVLMNHPQGGLEVVFRLGKVTTADIR